MIRKKQTPTLTIASMPRSFVDLSWLSEFAQRRLIPEEARNLEDTEFDLSLYKELHAHGFMTLAMTSTAQQPAPATVLIDVAREIGYGSVSAGGTFLGQVLGQGAVSLFGAPQLQTQIANDSAFALWCFGMSEANVGSNLTLTQTSARETPEGFILSGEKNYITNASHARHIVVFARLLTEYGDDLGISAFYVDGNAPGLVRGPAYDKTGWRKANTATLRFDSVKVPTINLLGERGQGLRVFGRCLNRSKVLMAAIAVGLSRRALDLLHARLATTERFDQALIDQPAIRHVLARLHTQVDAAWLMTKQGAEKWDANLGASTKESSQAKLFACQVAVEVANRAVELFGSRGLFNEYEVSRLLRDAKALEIIEGPPFIQELLIAKEVLPRTSAIKNTQAARDSVRIMKRAD